MKIRNTLGILSSEVPTGNLLWVDAVNGVDGAARRGRMTVPFRTLTAAKNAAQSGDTIVVLPGTYNEKDLLKHNINWHFMNGAVVSYTGTAAGGIFDNSSIGSVTCRITGHGQFSAGTTGANASTGYVLNLSGSTSIVYFQGEAMNSQAAHCLRITGASRAVIEALFQIGSTSGDCVSYEGTVSDGLRIQARRIYTSGPRAINVGTGSGPLYVDAQRISSVSDAALYVQGGTGPISIHAREIISNTNRGIYYNSPYSTPKLTIVGARIQAGGTGAAGRAVDIASTSSSYGVRLTQCVLNAPGDYAMVAPNGVAVVLFTTIFGNKTTNVPEGFVGGQYLVDASV